MLIIFATTFPCALLPYFFRKNAKFLLLGTQFAGGVFLATSMHFLSDSIEGKIYLSNSLFSLTLLGYFLTAFGEIILFKMLNKKKSGEPRAVVEVEEGRNAAVVVAEVVEEESVAAVGVAVLTIFGLAIHSLDEGFQIGQQRRTIYAWTRILPISIHHVFLAIGLGIVVLRMQPRRPFWTVVAYSFAFAISTPVGILMASTEGIVDWIFNVILMGIFSGVFIYISINHLIAKGFKPQEAQCSYDTPLRKFFSVVFGALISGW